MPPKTLLFAIAAGLSSAVLASHPVTLLNLQQRNADGSALCAGCTAANGTEIEIRADSDPATCGSPARAEPPSS